MNKNGHNINNSCNQCNNMSFAPSCGLDHKVLWATTTATYCHNCKQLLKDEHELRTS